MLINTNYFISLRWEKRQGFINQTITNKITGLVKGNYVDLTQFRKVSELPKRRLEV